MNTDLREPKMRSVYDFLYCDTRRVGSFLAQFNPSGHLTEQRKTRSQADKSGTDSSVGFDLKIIKGATGGNTSAEQAEQSEETYDPFWASAITLLDQLESRSLLRRDMRSARVGQLVLLAGGLKLLDLRILKSVWDVPLLTKTFVGTAAGRTQAEIDDSALTLEFVKGMPHTVQAQIHCSPEGEVPASLSWMILDPSGLVIPPSDILMKYGQHVPGLWSLLAIKDADPDVVAPVDEQLKQELATGSWTTAAAKRYTTPLSLIADTLAPRARAAMGRPGAYFGVTPIMIFREVNG